MTCVGFALGGRGDRLAFSAENKLNDRGRYLKVQERAPSGAAILAAFPFRSLASRVEANNVSIDA